MSWGIRYALASRVKEHGELADEADIWSLVATDPPFASEEDAQYVCESEDIDCDNIYVHRPYKMEPT